MATVSTRPQSQASVTDAAPAEVLPHWEAMKRYEGQWLLLQALSYDERQRPETVRVLAHSPRQSGVWQVLSKLVRERGKPVVPYRIVEAAQYISTGDEMRQALANAAESETGRLGVWRGW